MFNQLVQMESKDLQLKLAKKDFFSSWYNMGFIVRVICDMLD